MLTKLIVFSLLKLAKFEDFSHTPVRLVAAHNGLAQIVKNRHQPLAGQAV